MKISTFGFRGNFAFEKPIEVFNSTSNLLALATPYGDSAHVEGALNKMIAEFENLLSDPDSTSPYSKLTCLTPTENHIYTSTQFLNDYLYSTYNQDLLTVGCDFCLIYKKANQVFLSQIGWPLLVLHENTKNIPISSEYASKPKNLDESVYLPRYLLGEESSVNVKVQSFTVDSNSKLLILKSNQNPTEILKSYPEPLDSIAKQFVKKNSKQGFWLGEIEF